MARAKNSFRKLPGRGRKTFGLLSTVRSRLYLEADHLLAVSNDRFTESYKRFYFRDIHSLVFCRTKHGFVVSIILGALAALLLGLAIVGASFWNWGAIGWAILGPIISFFLLMVIINSFRGPTCLCQLKTAVTTEELPSLNRVRTARKVFALLRPIIEAVQGQLRADEIPAKLQDSLLNPNVISRRGKDPQKSEAKHEDGRYHQIVFGLLLADSLVCATDIFAQSVWLTLAGSALSLGLLAFTVVAVVRQNGSDIRKGLRSLMWCILGYLGLVFAFGFVFTIYLSIKHGVPADNQWEMAKLWSQESALDTPALLWVYSISSILSLVLGVEGLVLLRDHWRRAKLPPTPPPQFPSPAEPTAMT
jgi:hypothetical protein